MSAETLTSVQAAANYPVNAFSGAGVLQVAWGTYAVAATFEDGDIIKICKVPAGATIINGYLQMEDLDDGTGALDVMLGWAANGSDAADPNGLILAGAKPGTISVHLDIASSLIHFGGVITGDGPKTFAKETTIQLEANTPSNSFAAGRITVVVYYTVA
jgi:hypothetical protein